MSEMVERVAKAIHTLRNSTLESQARAAIEAMRVPTKAMIQAPEMRTWAWRTEEGVTAEQIADAWNAMIDEALK